MDRFRLGEHTRSISTTSTAAQRWFDRGLNWCFGFNHEEGVACFHRALVEDPECVMAHWGVAYAAGPFYNYPWSYFSEAELEACTALCFGQVQAGRSFANTATESENALVEALAQRFQEPHTVDMHEFDDWDDEYANAMRGVYNTYPDDHDVMALFVEAMINRTPWRLWDVKTGRPAEGADTAEALAVCERSIALSREQGVRQNPAILHLHIHLLEMSEQPERALDSADSLGPLSHDAGHLNHMPGHIYVLCGEYEKAKIASAAAIDADRKYMDYAGPFNFYTTARCHDLHLMMYACMFLGQYEESMLAAEEMSATLRPEILNSAEAPQLLSTLEGYAATKMHVLIRFGRWQDIVDAAMPEDSTLYCVSTAMHHYAKGVAHAALKQFDAAESERWLFREACGRVPPERRYFNNFALSILGIGQEMLAGELAYHRGECMPAFEHLREAVRIDDDLLYNEPWAWMHPPRHALGALLCEQGHYVEAEAIYRADLGLDHAIQRCAQHPENVWSLLGLIECLEVRADNSELSALRARLATAMAKADVAITSSCMCRAKAVEQS